jgi:mannose-6-phosphate isomerase-like protein (cupin superfamily)
MAVDGAQIDRLVPQPGQKTSSQGAPAIRPPGWWATTACRGQCPVGGEVRRDDVVLLPREDQPIFRVPTTGFERRSLSPVSHNGRAVDFCVNALPPGQSSGTFPPHHAGVEETLVVASGLLRLHLGDTVYELCAGDSVFYRAHVSHRFDNPSDQEPSIFYIVINGAGGN